MGKVLYTKHKQKRVGGAILTSDQTLSQNIIRSKEEHYTLIKILIKKGDITIYAPNNRPWKYMKQKLIEQKRE